MTFGELKEGDYFRCPSDCHNFNYRKVKRGLYDDFIFREWIMYNAMSNELRNPDNLYSYHHYFKDDIEVEKMSY